jgi:hypothetical protein
MLRMSNGTLMCLERNISYPLPARNCAQSKVVAEVAADTDVGLFGTYIFLERHRLSISCARIIAQSQTSTGIHRTLTLLLARV